jgi:hypothetical protein
LDYPVGNYYERLFNRRVPLPVKIIAIVVVIWVFNVLFVACHEAGHAITAGAFGAQVHGVYVSPWGLEGSTTHTVLQEKGRADAVVAGGVLATTAAIVIAYVLRLEVAVYVLGLRTLESLTNYTRGSDMGTLLASMGSDAFVVSTMLGLVALAVSAMAIDRRFAAMRMARAKKQAPGFTA